MLRFATLSLLVALVIPSSGADPSDLLVADFESETYGDWKAEGTAFGPGPAKGTLPGQMHVEGFEGERLINSFAGGDDSTGTLASPPFTIERNYLNFLIGGGAYANETCIDLLIDGNVVRSATGPNDRPGGSERLDWHTWDVTDLAGRTATIRIVDQRKGGWGHINVDQLAQSDRRKQAEPASRELRVAKRYLHLPVRNGAPKRRMKYLVDGATVRELEIELADEQPDFYAFSDVSPFAGKALRIEVDLLPEGSKALEAIVESDELPAPGELYAEPLRPQFHFTSRRGWLNDPNGLVYQDGEWHLFYQHNPFGAQWGNMHWGHAVSPDLMHWKELGEALYPHGLGDMAFSGSAVVDHRNTSGFGVDGKPPLVLAWTSTGRGECIAYSNDRGRSWTEYDGNPVVRHRGRDPKLIWHEPTKRWVMAVYDETDERQSIAFHSSPDLKTWTYESRIDGFFECPDLFPLEVVGDTPATKWVLYAADGEYMLGDFDGKTFRPDEPGKQRLWYGNFYASQTYDNAPDGRRVQIGWGRGIEFPGMPFNQQMTVPVDLTLRATPDGPRLLARPVDEIESLQTSSRSWPPIIVDSERILDVEGDLFDIQADITMDAADAAGVIVRGVPITFDKTKNELSCRGTTAPLRARNGIVRLRILADRGSIEIFGNDGEVAVSQAVISATDDQSVKVFATGGRATFSKLRVTKLRSAWRNN